VAVAGVALSPQLFLAVAVAVAVARVLGLVELRVMREIREI
jgi:hypothetical protein